MKGNDLAIAKMAAVLIPVVIGSLLGLTASITTIYYTFQNERQETIRKERLAHLERAMILAAKYSNDVAKALSVGLISKGNVASKDIAVLTAPSDTLSELSAVVSLYFPKLKGEVEKIHIANVTMMKRFDEITDYQSEHRGEDAAAFSQRIQKEITPAMESVRSLMTKLSACAAQLDVRRSSERDC